MEFLHAVAADGEVMLSGQFRHSQPSGYATAVGGIGLDEAELGVAECVFELVECVEVFAHGKGHAGRLGDASIALVVVRYGGLFEPKNIELGEGAGGGDGLVNGHGVVGVDHEGAVGAQDLSDGASTVYVGCEVGLADFDFDAVIACCEIALGLGDQFLQRKVQVDAAAIRFAPVGGSARHLNERLTCAFAAGVPKRDVDGRDRERGNSAPRDVVDMPLHSVVEVIDLSAVFADQERRQVMLDHRGDGSATSATSIGIARAFAAIREADRGGDQLEMGMIAVLRVGQDLGERNLEKLDLDGLNFGHGAPVRADWPDQFGMTKLAVFAVERKIAG